MLPSLLCACAASREADSPLLLNLFADVWISALHTHPHYEWWQIVGMSQRLLEALAFSFLFRSLTPIVNISETVTVMASHHQSHGAVSCNMETHHFEEGDSSLECSHPSVKWGPPHPGCTKMGSQAKTGCLSAYHLLL